MNKEKSFRSVLAKDDLGPETFQQWSKALEPLSANTRLARMLVVRNFWS